MLRIIGLLFFVLLPNLVSAESVAWGGSKNWQSRSSEHFIIHYPQVLDETAIRSLAIAENVHTALLPYFGSVPNSKTEMVLVDDFDFSNGWATAFPFNQIRLYVNPPEDVGGLEHTDDWLHGLILHEYVHVLHLDLGARINRDGRSFFGRMPWFFPHQFTPSMMKEGLAIYLESNHEAGYGRLDGSYLPMQMRAELLTHGGDSLSKVVIPMRDWPTSKAYLYGAYFFEFLAEQYGDIKVQQYLHRYSQEIIPYVFQNSVAKSVFGQSFTALWEEYLQWLAHKFDGSVHQTNGQALETLPNTVQATAVTKDGLWQVEANGEDRSRFVFWQQGNTKSAEEQKTPYAYTKNVQFIDAADDGTLVVSRQIPYANGSVFNDLFLWHKTAGWQRLTKQQRFTQARWLNNDSIIASRKILGVSELWQLDRQGQMLLLWQGEQGDVLGGFAVHPSGTSMVASIKRPQSGWNLERYDFLSNQWQIITQTKATEHQPEFLADGRLLYSADYLGQFNVFLLEIDSGLLQQVTQTNTGVFKPHLREDWLYYQEYTQAGFQLTREPLQVYKEFTLDQFSGSYHYQPHPTSTEVTASTSYSAWPSVLPKYWFPYIEIDNYSTVLGVMTEGADALGRHQYSFNIGHDLKNSLNQAELLYQYDNRWQLYARRNHNFVTERINARNERIIFQNDKLIAQRNHLFNAFEDQLQAHLGASVDNQRIVDLASHLVAVNSKVSERLVGAAISFDNRERYRQVTSVGWGTYSHLVYENANLIDNSYSGYRVQADVQHWIDLPGKSSLKLGLQGGSSSPTMSPFTLGDSKIKDENLLFNRSQFSLPGYPAYIQYGQHYYLAELRYNQWLARIERNLGLWPVGLGDLNVQAWVKNAHAWNKIDNSNSLTSIGIEAKIEGVVGYSMLLPITLGVAQGLDSALGETQGYVQLQLTF